jgi:DNA-binding response OmpR family regulator
MTKAWYVDDDQEMIQAMSLVLSLLEIDVRPFYTARAAARAFEKGERPDLLLLDINMPDVNGIDMLEFVRNKLALTDLPVMMLSSEHTDVQVHEALEKGADAYVMKPVTIDELEKAIQRVFAKYDKAN